MLLDALLPYGALLAVAVAAFAVSAGVGMILARLRATPELPDRRPSRSDPVR